MIIIELIGLAGRKLKLTDRNLSRMNYGLWQELFFKLIHILSHLIQIHKSVTRLTRKLASTAASAHSFSPAKRYGIMRKLFSSARRSSLSDEKIIVENCAHCENHACK
jgi:hypothetical protein